MQVLEAGSALQRFRGYGPPYGSLGSPSFPEKVRVQCGCTLHGTRTVNVYIGAIRRITFIRTNHAFLHELIIAGKSGLFSFD